MQSKKNYEVVRQFWHLGLLREVGETIMLFPSEVKYLAHALKEVVESVVTPAPVAEEAAAVAVEAAPAVSHHRRAKAATSEASEAADGDGK